MQVYDVEGRGSCGPFALAVSMGFKLGHAAVAGDELTAKVKKVTAKDRYIDLQLRWGRLSSQSIDRRLARTRRLPASLPRALDIRNQMASTLLAHGTIVQLS